jgi:phosphate transport system substrate-binding protein
MFNGKLFSFFALAVIIAFAGCEQSQTNSKKINFSGAFALYPLNIKWSEEYKKSHPDIIFNIQPGGAGKGLTDALAGNADAGMFSREISDNEMNKNVWYIALAKDAVFATINTNNPYIDLLKTQGLKKDDLKNIFITGTPVTWEALLNLPNKTQHKINVYTRSDASGAAESWSAYFNMHQDDLKGIGMMGDPGIADAVKKDANGIGFNNPQYIFELQTGEKIPGIEILPLDVNGNGKIDSLENFYSNLSALEYAAINDKYPSPPIRYLYFVCKQKPTNPVLLDYFKWVLTDGQQFIKGAGYVPLTEDVIQEQLDKLK